MSGEICWSEQLPNGGWFGCVLTHLVAVDLPAVAYSIWRGLLCNRMRKAILIHLENSTVVCANTI